MAYLTHEIRRLWLTHFGLRYWAKVPLSFSLAIQDMIPDARNVDVLYHKRRVEFGREPFANIKNTEDTVTRLSFGCAGTDYSVSRAALTVRTPQHYW
jgi:hypothetical protein